MRKTKEIPPLSAEDRAFAECLFLEHQKTLYYTARCVARDESLVEDLVQDCLLGLMKNISVLRNMSCNKIDAYIVVAIRRIYISHIRKVSGNAVCSLDVPKFLDDADRSYAEKENAKNELAEEVRAILGGLSERDRMILESYYIEGLTEEELAAVFNCKPASIRVMLHRARKRARAIGTFLEKGDVDDG